MSIRIYDLGGALVSEEQELGTQVIRGEPVPGNVAYTYITVKSTRHNDTKAKAITNDGASVPAEDVGTGNKFSATSRLTSSIALPLPRNIPFSWSNDWSQQETGFLEQAIAGALGGQFSSIVDGGDAGLDAAKNKALDLAHIIGLRKYVQQNVGAVANPFKEIFYNGVQFRTFNFSWEFAPQNAKESKTLEDLIYYLELSSHPELVGGDTSAYYIPDVFNVEFKGTNIPKLQTLALTNMNVEYAPFGPKILKDKNAAFVNIDLQFIELYPLTKEDIRKSRGREIGDLFPQVTGGPL